MKKVKKIITEETFRNYARTQGWYYTILSENISFTIDKEKYPSNMLSVIRKCFNNYYVGRENCGKYYKITIYTGDKETQKFFNTPIKFETPRQAFNRELKKDMKKLKETYNK